MRSGILAALLLAASAACAATPAEVEPAIAAEAVQSPQSPPSFRWHRTGGDTYVYHQVWGGCETLSHGHGRNYAWGRWDMPLADVVEHGAEETESAGALVRFTCRDGSACIGKGSLQNEATESLSEHTIPFETMALARTYAEQVSALKTACQLPQ